MCEWLLRNSFRGTVGLAVAQILTDVLCEQVGETVGEFGGVGVTAVSARRSHHPANGDPGIRVGDRQREKVVTRVGQAFTQGYLSIPEYETRLDRS